MTGTGSGEGGEHVVRIWRVSDSTCIAGPYTWNITSGTAGWNIFTLPAPLNIYANTDYIVCVSNSTDKWWPRTAYGFNNPINNGNLITYTGSGVYSTTLGTMPTTVSQNNNYFRDVVFVALNQN